MTSVVEWTYLCISITWLVPRIQYLCRSPQYVRRGYLYCKCTRKNGSNSLLMVKSMLTVLQRIVNYKRLEFGRRILPPSRYKSFLLWPRPRLYLIFCFITVQHYILLLFKNYLNVCCNTSYMLVKGNVEVLFTCRI